jgi:ABC-2 type transport system permease protein
VFGTVSSAITGSLSDNKSVNDIFNRLGASLSAKGYVGITFVILAAVVAMTAASFVSAARAEEADGRLEYLASGPVARWRWLTGRVAVALGVVVVVGLAAGLGGWLGVRMSGGHIPFGSMVEAGLNLVAPAVLVLGVGTLAHGVAARTAATVAYTIVVWSFIVELIGSVVKFNHYLLDTSIIHHVAAAPAVDPRWDAAAVMVGLGVVAAFAGAIALQHRDLIAA